MPDIKKHYKILIAILIVITLISSFIVYDITPKNINYNNNGEPIDVKYFDGIFPPILFRNTGNHTASSYYVSHNKLSYMNSTITIPRVSRGAHGCLCFGINIHLKNINKKYIYIDIKSPSEPSVLSTCLNNVTAIHLKYTNGICHTKYKINGNNISIPSIDINCINKFVHNNYFNISVKIALSNNFYNLFDISTIKETAIYGTIGSSPGCSDSGCFQYINYSDATYNLSLNSTLLIENNNTHTFHTVPIRDGYFYFFAKPYTEYKLYYLGNSTLEEFKYDNGTIINSIETGSSGSSICRQLYE